MYLKEDDSSQWYSDRPGGIQDRKDVTDCFYHTLYVWRIIFGALLTDIICIMTWSGHLNKERFHQIWWPVLNEYGWECHGRYLYQLRADKIKRNRFKDFSLAATLFRDEPLKQLWPPKPVEMPERVSNLTAIQKNKDRQRKLNYNIPNIIKKKVWQTSKPVEMRAERLRSERTDNYIRTRFLLLQCLFSWIDQ